LESDMVIFCEWLVEGIKAFLKVHTFQ